MSRRSRSDAGVQVWLKFGPVPPTIEALAALEVEMRKLFAAYGLGVYAMESWVKDGRMPDGSEDQE